MKFNQLPFAVIFTCLASLLFLKEVSAKDESTAAPKIIKMEPENWAVDVDPEQVRELRVTFDQDMNTSGFSWCGGGETYPKTTDKPQWIDKRTCILPVQLEKAKRYRLSINAVRFKNFKSEKGVPVVPVPYTFFTVGCPEIKYVQKEGATSIVFFTDTSYSPIVVNGTRHQQWKTDLAWLRETLPKKHKNLFFKMPQIDFENRLDQLIATISDKTDRELMAEFYRTIISIDDSHTSIRMDSTFWPVAFFQFEEGIFVIGVDARFGHCYGKQLTAVNGLPIEQVLGKLQPFIHRDNAYFEKNALAQALSDSKRLWLAGLRDSENEVSYSFGEETVSLSTDDLASQGSQSWLPKPEQTLLSQQHRQKNYWFQWINEKNLYVKYNACSSTNDYPINDFIKDVFKEIKEKSPDKLIVDLRDNSGGSSHLLAPFISGIRKYPKLNTPERFKVIVGRRTFSSAMLNALELKAMTKATFVGEPTGSKMNHYGEVKILILSNIQVNLGYSSKYFQRSKGDEDALYPDVQIPMRAEDWFHGKDAFLDAALK